MTVKYYCPKCGRRFVDWGAEKLGFKCPSETCEGEPLVLPGAESPEAISAMQKIKRSKKRKAILPAVTSDIDVSELEDDFVGDVELDEEEGEEIEESVDEIEAPIIVDDEDTAVVDVIVEDEEEGDDDTVFDEALTLEDDVDLEEE